LQAAVKANPASREAHMFLAEAFHQLGMTEQAESERVRNLPAQSTSR
jgi:Tfp pilus assembly protein PilF